MGKEPIIYFQDNLIIIKTENSQKNSALLIYKIEYQLDTLNKEIELSAFQSIGKKYCSKFEIKINGFSKSKLESYNYYWKDPDNKRTKIVIKE
jgi:hypothetical protein